MNQQGKRGRSVYLEPAKAWAAIHVAGLQQKDIAKAVGASQKTVSRWVNALAPVPMHRLNKLAEAMHASPKDITRTLDAPAIPRSVKSVDRPLEEVQRLMGQLSPTQLLMAVQFARGLLSAKLDAGEGPDFESLLGR